MKIAKIINFVTMAGFIAILIKPEILYYIGSFYNFAAVKAVFGLGVIYIYRHRKDIYKVLSKSDKNEFMGIPKCELIEYLFKHGNFKQDEVKEFFGLPHNKAVKLAGRLEDLGILIRGSFNAFILNDKLTRGKVADKLSNKVEIEIHDWRRLSTIHNFKRKAI